MLKETLKELINLQKKDLERQELGVLREVLHEIDFAVPHALVISGIRRCGKSTLLHQLMKKVKKPYYFNFEDPRALNFQVSDFEKLAAAFAEVHGSNGHYFFDEIQNVPNWERFVRKLIDTGSKCVITGSNASLLSRELGTRLTGRHLTYELFPFSYKEFLEFKKEKASAKTFQEYLMSSGFPEYLRFQKDEILHALFNDILSRDIAVRHGLKEGRTIRELTAYILSNIGKEFSYNKLAATFNLGSPNTVISYISFLEDSYMVFTVPRFSFSLQKQRIMPKKAYAIDQGLIRANAVQFSNDTGRILENIVFLHLRRKNREIYYFKEKNECDFITRGKETAAFQVCSELTEDNKQREIDGLKEAMKKIRTKKGTILTLNQEDSIGPIQVIPVWKWLTAY